jgi:type I restriction enzyme, S subunit
MLALVEQEFAIHLPDTDNLIEALTSVGSRAALITHWLQAYRDQVGATSFSVPHFTAAAQKRLAELHPDGNFELGINEYEHIKNWVFQALTNGLLTQTFDDVSNRIQLKAVQQ